MISFIISVNALSPFNLKQLLERILEWQKESYYLYDCNYRRIFLDLPFLRAPAWQSLTVLPKGIADPYFKSCLDFMEKNRVDLAKKKYYGFSDFQINKMKRLIDLSNQEIDPELKKSAQIDFYKFFKEHDKRRQTNLVETFPELNSFWTHCKRLSLS